MHSKRKGNIGQFTVALELSKLGYSVFTEQGDISKIDLIAEKDGKLIKIQSKAITPTDGRLVVPLKKSGPNYSFIYEQGIFDYFAAVDLEDKKVYLIPDMVLANHNSSFVLRKTQPKNNQISGVNMASDYLIDKVLS